MTSSETATASDIRDTRIPQVYNGPGQPDNPLLSDPMHRRPRIASALVLAVLVLGGCATRPPQDTENICAIFDEQPRWYDHAKDSEDRWGTPIAIQMAIIYQESSFRSHVRPPRDYLFGVIPLPRSSSAVGYAQIQDAAWSDYLESTGRRWASRSDIADALDFIGWYNDISNRRLRIPKTDAERLYLAYHEGHGGYSRGTYRNKPQLQSIARRVSRRADDYGRQLPSCEDRLRCRHFWQVWPFCR